MIIGTSLDRLMNRLNANGPGGGPGDGNDPSTGSAVTTGSNTTADGSPADGDSTVSGAATGRGDGGYAPASSIQGDFEGISAEAAQTMSGEDAMASLGILADNNAISMNPVLSNNLGKNAAQNTSDFNASDIMTDTSQTIADNSLTGKITGKDVMMGLIPSPIPGALQGAESFGMAMATLTGVLVGQPDPGMTTGGPDSKSIGLTEQNNMVPLDSGVAESGATGMLSTNPVGIQSAGAPTGGNKSIKTGILNNIKSKTGVKYG